MISIKLKNKIVLVSVQVDSKRAKIFLNRDHDRINHSNFGGRTLARSTLICDQKITYLVVWSWSQGW
ncbi:hypothetical protein BpHYR1_031936 [Brachionus plicatilis]|uniref:Uncharacterized protein n=1 Tax=Brachionus plicatilis TaxID=10195 RepID=A0A3M7PNI9_BRAPC|nr:hypothetical protein BpHYR1_031936 [Brachionus plicatilis]